jgi:hypothetical protein
MQSFGAGVGVPRDESKHKELQLFRTARSQIHPESPAMRPLEWIKGTANLICPPSIARDGNVNCALHRGGSLGRADEWRGKRRRGAYTPEAGDAELGCFALPLGERAKEGFAEGRMRRNGSTLKNRIRHGSQR